MPANNKGELWVSSIDQKILFSIIRIRKHFLLGNINSVWQLDKLFTVPKEEATLLALTFSDHIFLQIQSGCFAVCQIFVTISLFYDCVKRSYNSIVYTISRKNQDMLKWLPA